MSGGRLLLCHGHLRDHLPGSSFWRGGTGDCSRLQTWCCFTFFSTPLLPFWCSLKSLYCVLMFMIWLSSWFAWLPSDEWLLIPLQFKSMSIPAIGCFFGKNYNQHMHLSNPEILIALHFRYHRFSINYTSYTRHTSQTLAEWASRSRRTWGSTQWQAFVLTWMLSRRIFQWSWSPWWRPPRGTREFQVFSKSQGCSCAM